MIERHAAQEQSAWFVVMRRVAQGKFPRIYFATTGALNLHAR
jgi:hypothetical protein